MENSQIAAELYREARDPLPSTTTKLIAALASTDASTRHVAAIELAELAPQELTHKALEELVDTLARLENMERPPLVDEYSEMAATVLTEPDDWRDLGQSIVLAFAKLQCGQADCLIPRLIEFWSYDGQFYELAHALITLAFPITDLPMEKRNLSGVQYRVLQALTQNTEIWLSDSAWVARLPRHGLPLSRDATFEFLGYTVW